MDFENQYLTYEEYKLLGGKLVKPSFNLLEYRAEKKIDQMSSNRFRKLKKYPQSLKLCVYELIDVFYSEGDYITLNETVGNYSKTKQSRETIEREKGNIIKQYLSEEVINGVGALYRGVDYHEN